MANQEKVKGEKKRNSAGMRHGAMKVKQNQRSKEKKKRKKEGGGELGIILGKGGVTSFLPG